MTTRDHNRLLGIFFLINGGLSAFGGIIAVIIYGGIGTLMATSARDEGAVAVGSIFVVVSVFIALFIFVFAGFYLFTGWKMYKEAGNGRILGIIASILSLMSFPLGTALGIYGLWFLFSPEGTTLYEGGGISNNPPPPNSWQ